MDLTLSDDQRLLKDMVDRFAADHGGLAAHRAAKGMRHGWSAETWRRMAELGLTGLLLSEADGGSGGGGSELMIMGEAFGRHLMTEPFLDSAVVAGGILSGVEGGTGTAAAIEGLIQGSRHFALVAHGVRRDRDGLHGAARFVPGAHAADGFIVFAGGGAEESALFLVDGDAAGVTRTGYPLHGGGGAADLVFASVAATPLAGGNLAGTLLEEADARRTVFLAAEALGVAEAAFGATVDYLKTRIQFGKPLGANQALQHRAAEMFVEIEQMRSAAMYAACMLAETDRAERSRALAACRHVAVKGARFVAQQAVQLHGGIGVTEEHVIGHYFLRLTALCVLLAPPPIRPSLAFFNAA